MWVAGAVVVSALTFLWVSGTKWTPLHWLSLLEVAILPSSVVIAIYFFDRYVPKNLIARLGLKVLTAIIVIAVFTLFTNLIAISMGYPDDDTLSLGTLGEVNPFWTNVITNMVITALITLPVFSISDRKDRSIVHLNSQLNLLKTELYSSNVRPHFIFNALNSITELIHEDPQKAEDLTLNLASFLRRSLYERDDHIHTLQDELSAIEEYLSIEQSRYSGFSFEINNSVDTGIIVPKFCLIPLVENAVKYNRLSPQTLISIKVYYLKEEVIIELVDNGNNFPEDLKPGTGIRTTHALLRTCFGEKYRLDFINTPIKKVRVQIPSHV